MLFRFKVLGLTGKRFLRNVFSPTKKFPAADQLSAAPIIALSQSDLWNPDDNAENWILTAGKIQNLRIASGCMNGIEIKANDVFSFWKHIGNPNFGKTYVVGREIREGCIVPTIAGGLCQLSNALYDAALQANFQIIERHKHTRVIPGSLAEKDRDATVKWNYMDLRFVSKFDFKIEVELLSDQLVVRFRSYHHDYAVNEVASFIPADKLNDCYSCGNISCDKHSSVAVKQKISQVTTFIVDEKWQEFDVYIKSIAKSSDHLIVPLLNKWIRTERYNWTASKVLKTHTTSLHGIYRALKLRFAGRNKNVFQLNLELDKKIALATVKYIPVATTHLVISQNLLPYIYEAGVLGGRTYDVLMNRLPLEKLNERLDHAHTFFPQSSTINDFRAENSLRRLENAALTKARNVVTPHVEIAAIFRNKVVKLDWMMPATKLSSKGTKILFPASAVARKGCYEIRKLAQELGFSFLILGEVLEAKDFFAGIDVQKFTGNFDEIGLIIYPTYIEHQPRILLKAISYGIPIITTKASGLDGSDKVVIVAFGNYEQLKKEILLRLH